MGWDEIRRDDVDVVSGGCKVRGDVGNDSIFVACLAQPFRRVVAEQARRRPALLEAAIFQAGGKVTFFELCEIRARRRIVTWRRRNGFGDGISGMMASSGQTDSLAQ